MTSDTALTYCECTIKDKYKLANEFNEHYTNTAKKTDGTKLVKLGVSENLCDDEKIINDNLESYKGHPSILVIPGIFRFQENDILKVKELLNNTDAKKAISIESILP